MATANGDGLDGVGLRKDMDTMELMENGDGDALHVALVLCGDDEDDDGEACGL